MDYKKELASFLADLTNLSFEETYSLLEIPTDKKMGDFAFPCFKLSKLMKKAPPLIALELKDKIVLPNYIGQVENVNGFLNFFVDKTHFVQSVIETVAEQKERYGCTNEGNGKTIVLDYSSPNMAKRFHIAHLYSTAIGNALYRIYKFLGYNSFGINYLGDWGTQFGKLIVAYKLWGDKERLERDGVAELEKLYVRFHEEAESNAELEEEARAAFFRIQEKDEEAVAIWQYFREISLEVYQKSYNRMNIHFDSYNGESFYNDKMDAVANELREKDLLIKSDGAMIVDLEQYKMPPCLILRRDGGTLYPTRDIASAIYRKKTYNFHKAIYVTDMRQSLHFAQWFKVIGLMGYEWEKDLVHVPYGLLSLTDGPLSSRKGHIIPLDYVLDEAVECVKEIINEKNPNLENKDIVAEQVGVGAVIFSSLFNSRIKDVVFSLDKVLSFEGETGPYVQYTHARAASVLAKAGEITFDNINHSVLSDDASFETIKLVYEFQDRVRQAAERNEPFLVSRYLVQLAQQFNKFYHDNPILNADEYVRRARLAVVYCVKIVIASGLYLIGIEAPEKM